MLRLSFLTIFIVYFANHISGQIPIKNGSFEQAPRADQTPTKWYECSRGATPDILPGPWDVNLPASDGETYLGLITREDGSYESIAQKLEEQLDTEECYFINFDLCRSSTYAQYNLPIRLRIYLGSSDCDRQQLIFNSPTISSEKWQQQTILFVPSEAFDHIIFEAYYANGVYIEYNGNILLDNISPICICPRA